MSQYKDAAIGDTVYFWFAANLITGAAGDGVTPLYAVRLAGAASTAAPKATGTPTLLTNASYTDGLHEIALDTTGWMVGEYAVFCTLTISTVNPAGFCGSFTLRAAASSLYEQVGKVIVNTTGIPTANAIADAVWDEVISPTAHNTAGVAGDRLLKSGYIVKDEGLCAGGAQQTITLGATASAVASIYCQDLITIIYGTGIGQSRLIVGYTADKIATVDRPWDVTPISGDSYYQIIAFTGLLFAATGTAVSAAAGTITLASSALGIANSYVGCAIYISSGTGSGQTRLITAYTAERVASISPNWDTTPDNTSAYKILPVGRSIIESTSSAAAAAIADQVWDEAMAGHVAAGSTGEKLNSLTATLGAGAIAWPYTLTNSLTGLPIADAHVWVTTDIGGLSIVASGTTNALGQITFQLDAGTYYIWRAKAGWDFTNPQTCVVS